MNIGIDEVGRGPVAGPVTLCAFARNTSVIKDEEILTLFPKKILKDSKKLSKKTREEIFVELEKLQKEGKIHFVSVARSATDIDEKGISLCIKECISELLKEMGSRLSLSCDDFFVYLDGSLHAPKEYTHQETIIKGDEKIIEIACASIVAKVLRDAHMKELGISYKEYGFEKHVGYGTKAHYEAIKKYGMTKFHRTTFLKKLLAVSVERK